MLRLGSLGSAIELKMVLSSPQTLLLVQCVVLLDYMCVGGMRTVLPYYARSLGAAATGVAALEALYGVGQVVGALLLGRLSDRRGRKAVLLVSFAGSAIGYAGAAVAMGTKSATLLLLSRLPVGLAKQTITASRSIIGDVTSTGDRTSAMARLFSSMALGYSCGPFLGGVLLDNSPAPAVPALLCALVFVALMPVVAMLLPETRGSEQQQQPSDAADDDAAAAHDGAKGAPGDGAGGDGAGGGAAAEERRGAWRNASVRAVIIAAALPEAALVAGSTALPLYVHELGWSASRLGAFHSVWGLGGGLLGLGPLPWLTRRGGWLTDRRAVLAGDVCMAAATALLAAAPSEAALWGVLALFIPAVALLRTAPAALLSKVAPARLRGEALGLLDAASSVSRIVMPVATGLLVERLGSTTAPFWLQAALSVAGLVILKVSGVGAVVADDEQASSSTALGRAKKAS